MLKANFQLPIDAIYEYLDDILICSYHIENNIRTGKIQLLDKNNLCIKSEHKTSGTLNAAIKDRKLFLANSSDISLYENMNFVKTINTDHINTYVFIGKYVYVSNLNGEINFYDLKLNFIKKIKMTKEPIWVVKEHNNSLYFGDESSKLFVYDLLNDNHNEISFKRDGIIEIIFENNFFTVFSYDNNILTYNNNLEIISKKTNKPSIWKIIKYKNYYICACIYDGLVIFDQDFVIIKKLKTESICYGLCMCDNFIYFSSFYDKNLYKLDVEEFLNE